MEANAFVNVLYGAFRVLRTMPPEHFAGFRESTGNASAIQSRNYQVMDIYLRGVDPEKRDLYIGMPHLADLARFEHPRFVSLRRALATVAESRVAGADQVLQEARLLDERLLTWRGLHLAFAKSYLPDGGAGTGGTVGAPYLARLLRAGLFPGSVMDVAVVRELFPELPDVERWLGVSPGVSISPEEARRSVSERQLGGQREPKVGQ